MRQLPDVTLAPYLAQYLIELGIYKSTGMGLAPLDWVDIRAWVELTGTEILPEEARILRELSAVYLSHSNKGKEPDAPAPFLERETTADRGANIKEQMQAFKTKRGAKRG